jgi:hypothetical protein
MKTLLIMVFILLALVGAMSVVIYASNHKANVQIKETSLLYRESMASARGGSAYGGEGTAQFTPVTRIESGTLAVIEDQSLLGLSAGAFNPRFESLSASEQNTLNTRVQQNPELQDMTAGNSDNNSGLSLGSALLIVLILLILF